MIRLLFLVLVSIPFGALSQLMSNDMGEIYTDKPFFNEAFIREHQIKEIKGRYSYKLKGRQMKETNEFEVFKFDTLGRLVESFETRLSDGTMDTMFNKYFYNSKGLMIYHSYGTSRKWKYETYLYDAYGRVVAIDIFQQYINFTGDLISLKEKTQTYSYAKEGADSVRIINNSFNLPYKREVIEFNEAGKITKLDNRFITNKEGWVDELLYNEQNQVIKRTHQSTREDKPKLTTVFTYDEHGNIMSKNVYRYIRHIEEYQFIFNSSTNLCSAILSRDPATDNIVVLRFQSYAYYGEKEDLEEE